MIPYFSEPKFLKLTKKSSTIVLIGGAFFYGLINWSAPKAALISAVVFEWDGWYCLWFLGICWWPSCLSWRFISCPSCSREAFLGKNLTKQTNKRSYAKWA